ncbi:MAG: hypothetical protein K2U26_01685 [Cyclobacteriaceae bacterium]|nr:hypothetical protein [Cyclobacteriaceae bacterium]
MKRIGLFLIFAIMSANIFAQKTDDATAQSTSSGHRFFIHRSLDKEKDMKKVISWWEKFQDCKSPRIIDTVKSISFNKVVCSGQAPVQYTLFGTTSDGGIIKFTMTIELTGEGADIVISPADHKATPGVKHKDGGNIFSEKPQKGSQILGRTWKGYQEQFSAIIKIMENDLNKIL